MNLQDIRDEITRLSGSGKRIAPGARTHGIYTTFTLPELDDMPAVRDTMQRFRDFAIPERLDGQTVIDVGCNVGAVAFEFARRGATVVGVEYRDDRVALCDVIAGRYELPCSFYAADLNLAEVRLADWASRRYDVVWSSSVDEYMENPLSLYRLLRQMCVGVAYIESNLQGRDSESVAHSLIKDAFGDVAYVGNGHSGGISRKRKLFVARGGTL